MVRGAGGRRYDKVSAGSWSVAAAGAAPKWRENALILVACSE